MNPSTETSVADDQLAAFIDRILRLKTEADDIAADIKEIYQEAHANGFNKTRLGEVVTYLRKVEKDATGEAEKAALRDLYLEGYYRAKNQPHAYARARGGNSEPAHDPETGEITEPQEAQAPAQAGPDDAPVASVPVESIAAEISTPIQNNAPAADEQLEGETERALGGAAAVSAGPNTPPVSTLTAAVAIAGSSNGRTAEFDSADAGSTPAPASIAYPAPGVVVMETCPPEGALAHPYAACWPVRDIDVSEGVREPIVKIGKLILDGRGRMFAARGWDGGKGREYPVVQYDGTDPLMDCIRWNLTSRPGIHPHNLKLIAGKLCKLEPTRADEIMQAFGLEVAEAAE